MQKTSTVAVISNNKVLLLLRGITAPYKPSHYCLPGGHAEEDESLENAGIRELLEETGINVSIDNIEPVIVNYKNYSKTVFVTKLDDPIVTLNWEHSDYVWVGLNDAVNYDLVPGLGTTIKTLGHHGHLI
jgi:8-oxo-dGTP pyrophosphatase MutT (NUDIX family)